MINKQLLEEVLGISIKSIATRFEDDLLLYRRVGGRHTTISSFKLQHLCKNWALTKDYMISSRYIFDYKQYRAIPYHQVDTGEYADITGICTADEEHDAVFKVCEWLLILNLN